MKLRRTTFRSRQRGLSFISLIFVGFLAVATFAIGGQSIPIFLEYQAIRKAALKASKEGSTVGEILLSTTSVPFLARTWRSPNAETKPS